MNATLRCGLAWLALVVAAWLAWREDARATRTLSALAATESAIANGQARLALVRAREKIAAQMPAASDAGPVAPVARPAQKPATDDESKPKRYSVQPWLTRVFAEEPGLQALYLDAYRKKLEVEHSALMRRLGLNVAESARFLEILARDMERATDIGAATRAQNLSSVDPEIKALTEQRERDRKEALRVLLGPERMKQLEAGDDQRMNRETIGEFAASLHATPTPLTPAQGNDLAVILRDFGWLGLPVATDEAYTTLATRAAGILAPGQLEVFQTLVEAHRARGRLNELTRAPRGGRSPSTGAGPSR